MVASYFVSDRGHAGRVSLLPRPRRAGADRARASSAASTWLADGYARTLRRVLPLRLAIVVAAPCSWSPASGWVAIAAAEHVLPRDRRVDGARLRAPRAGHVARGCLARRSRRWARPAQEAARRDRRPRAHQRRLAEGNARSAMTSPNWGPHMGFIRLALVDPEDATLIAARDRRSGRARSSTQRLPGRRVPAVAGRPRRERVLERLHRAARRRGPRRQPRASSTRRRARSPRSRARCRGIRDVWPTLQIDYPEIRVDTDREEAGLVGVTARERGADDARGDARQHQHAERLGRRRQRSVLLRRHRLRRRRASTTPSTLARDPGARRRARRRGHARRVRRRSDARSGPIAIERNQLQRAAHVLMQTEGRDIGSAAAELEAEARRTIRAPPASRSTSSVRSS